MSINLLFRSQYTSESNFNSISSCGEILDANVGSLERWDFPRVPVIFLKWLRINLLFRSQYMSESNFHSISPCGEILGANVNSNGYVRIASISQQQTFFSHRNNFLKLYFMNFYFIFKVQ